MSINSIKNSMIICVTVLINQQAMGTGAAWHAISKQQKEKSIHYFILGGFASWANMPSCKPNASCQLQMLLCHSQMFIILCSFIWRFRDICDDCKFWFLIYLGAVEWEVVAFLLYYCYVFTSNYHIFRGRIHQPLLL